jgi:hypothetical protein
MTLWIMDECDVLGYVNAAGGRVCDSKGGNTHRFSAKGRFSSSEDIDIRRPTCELPAEKLSALLLCDLPGVVMQAVRY